MLVSFSSNDSTVLARRKAGQQWCYFGAVKIVNFPSYTVVHAILKFQGLSCYLILVCVWVVRTPSSLCCNCNLFLL